MDKKFGVYILLGLVIGAMYGTFFGRALENMLLGIALGAFSGIFLGWFVAIAVQEQKKIIRSQKEKMITKASNKIESMMTLEECQREMRTVFLGGFAGQLVSGLIWLAATIVSVWLHPRTGMVVLFFGSMFIFPLTQGTLRLMGSPAKVSKENKLWGLGSQVAFIVPINFLLVGAATLYREEWFLPAAMIVIGTHYLPFITLYGMKMFGILAGLLIISGAYLAIYGPGIFSLGGWTTALMLIVFAFAGRYIVLKEAKNESALPNS